MWFVFSSFVSWFLWRNVFVQPSAEDSPNTTTTTATPRYYLIFKSPFRFSLTCSIFLNLSTSFILTPVNYFDYDITMESRNVILFKNEAPLNSTIAVSSKISTVCQMLHQSLNIMGLEWPVWMGLWILKGWLRLDERRRCLLGWSQLKHRTRHYDQCKNNQNSGK